MQKAMETRGESLLKGFNNFVTDFQAGDVQMARPTDFTVGKDLATTPGKVVFRNRLLEVIHYTPTRDKVFTDAHRDRHAVDQQVLHPRPQCQEEHGQVPGRPGLRRLHHQLEESRRRDARCHFDDYLMEGVGQIIETARGISGSAKVHAVGYCIGGAALATWMAWANAHYERRMCRCRHGHLLTTLVDYHKPGDIEVFPRREAASSGWRSRWPKRATSTARKWLPHSACCAPTAWSGTTWCAATCSARRRRLSTSCSGTWIPPHAGAMHSWYLRNFYLENLLIKKDALTLAGEKIDLGRISQPLYAVSAEDDHIAPWRQTFRINNFVAGPRRYVLIELRPHPRHRQSRGESAQAGLPRRRRRAARHAGRLARAGGVHPRQLVGGLDGLAQATIRITRRHQSSRQNGFPRLPMHREPMCSSPECVQHFLLSTGEPARCAYSISTVGIRTRCTLDRYQCCGLSNLQNRHQPNWSLVRMSTTQPLFQHHKHCDEIFADAEEACGNGDWVAGAKAFADFAGQLETHFKSEEEVLFPAFESATGMVSGPTEVMRGEHRQMRELLAQMKAGARRARRRRFWRNGGNLADHDAAAQHEGGEHPLPDVRQRARRIGCRRFDRPKACWRMTIVIDGRELQPPEPMERTLEALDRLARVMTSCFCCIASRIPCSTSCETTATLDRQPAPGGNARDSNSQAVGLRISRSDAPESLLRTGAADFGSLPLFPRGSLVRRARRNPPGLGGRRCVGIALDPGSTGADVHLIAAGFMLQAMSGAMFQFIPVAVGGNVWRPLWSPMSCNLCCCWAALLLVAGFLFSAPVLLSCRRAAVPAWGRHRRRRGLHWPCGARRRPA
jgi:hypothetical protein